MWFDMPALNEIDLWALSKGELITLLSRRPVRFDDADLHALWAATVARLRTLDNRVREGKCVEEASEFARWVASSGLLRLLQGRDTGELVQGGLKVSGDELKELISSISSDCEAYWNNHPRGPWVSLSELESISLKLDRIAARVALSAPAEPAQTVETQEHTNIIRLDR
jgi:hypothetical protein